MYVIALDERFDNCIKNLPIAVCRAKKDADMLIDRFVEEDLKKEIVKGCEVFNGKWTDDEKRRSLRYDYKIYEVSDKFVIGV